MQSRAPSTLPGPSDITSNIVRRSIFGFSFSPVAYCIGSGASLCMGMGCLFNFLDSFMGWTRWSRKAQTLETTQNEIVVI